MMTDEGYQYEDDYSGAQVLWGRVLVLLLALVLAFWLGTTFGGDDDASAQLAEQREQIQQLEGQVRSLEEELTAQNADGEQVAQGDSASEPAQAGGQPTDQASPEEEPSEYVVQQGDSLTEIAEQVYGDPTLWPVIAEANGIDDPSNLTVGSTLKIPPQP